MSISAPFAVISKCIRRLDSDPETIIVESNDDNRENEAKEKAVTSCDAQDLSPQSQPHCIISKGSTESGWVFRDEGDEPLFSQSPSQPSSCSMHIIRGAGTLSKHSTGDPGEDSESSTLSLARLSEDVGLYPAARKIGLRNLPHPSKLRRKARMITKRVHAEREQPVEQHIQQLKRKRAAYFSSLTEISTPEVTASRAVAAPATCCSASVEFSMPGPVPFTATSPRPPPEKEEANIDLPASMLGSVVPLMEDDEDRWFKSHWKPHESKYTRKLEE